MEDTKTICDLCQSPLSTRKHPPDYVDGKTTDGPWANMCISCWATHGIGLGTGLGQLYSWNAKAHRYQKIGG